MAKVSFNKLGLKLNQDVKIINYNNQNIEVKQYLPVQEKLDIITDILVLTYDGNNFANPVKVQVYLVLKVIEKYTNIIYTDKQKDNPTKLYDLFLNNELADLIINTIPKEEYLLLEKQVYETISAFYNYRNSAVGIVDNIIKDYSDTNIEASNIQSQLNNTESLNILKDVLMKLG